jgi:hypothetical protein
MWTNGKRSIFAALPSFKGRGYENAMVNAFKTVAKCGAQARVYSSPIKILIFSKESKRQITHLDWANPRVTTTLQYLSQALSAHFQKSRDYLNPKENFSKEECDALLHITHNPGSLPPKWTHSQLCTLQEKFCKVQSVLMTSSPQWYESKEEIISRNLQGMIMNAGDILCFRSDLAHSGHNDRLAETNGDRYMAFQTHSLSSDGTKTNEANGEYQIRSWDVFQMFGDDQQSMLHVFKWKGFNSIGHLAEGQKYISKVIYSNN